jgi:uncharacterized membrane protein YkgB
MKLGWFFEKNKTFAKLTKKREKIHKNWRGKWTITTDTSEILGIIKNILKIYTPIS